MVTNLLKNTAWEIHLDRNTSQYRLLAYRRQSQELVTS